MITVLIVIHVLITILLMIVILMQSGRGGGLTEAFASAESMFGAQTSSFLIRTTSVLATIFIINSLTLAFLSSKKDKSLMDTRSLMAETMLPKKSVPVNPVAVGMPAVDVPAAPTAPETPAAPVANATLP